MTTVLNTLPALVVSSILIIEFLVQYQAWLNTRPTYAYAKSVTTRSRCNESLSRSG